MPRIKNLRFACVLILQACATTTNSRGAARAPLEMDFDLIDGHLDGRGHVQGRLMIHVISGAAVLLRNIDPVLQVASEFHECSRDSAVSVVAVDDVLSKREMSRVTIDEGYWFGRDYTEMLLPPDSAVPQCVEGEFSVGAIDGSDETVFKVVKKKLRLFQRM